MKPSGNDYAKLNGLYTFYKPKDTDEIKRNILTFLEQQSVSINDVDIIIRAEMAIQKMILCIMKLDNTLFANKIES